MVIEIHNFQDLLAVSEDLTESYILETDIDLQAPIGSSSIGAWRGAGYEAWFTPADDIVTSVLPTSPGTGKYHIKFTSGALNGNTYNILDVLDAGTEYLQMSSTMQGVASLGDTFDIYYTQWIPFGLFYGVFDGNWHTISNMKYVGVANNVGFFSDMYTTSSAGNAEVHRLFLKDIYLDGGVTGIASNSYGGITGNNHGAITCCKVTGYIRGRNSVGGIVGNPTASYQYIEECVVDVTIVCLAQSGGIAGNGGTLIRNCYAQGKITRASGTSTTIASFHGRPLSQAREYTSYSTVETNVGRTDRGFWGFAPSRSLAQYCYFDKALTKQNTTLGGAIGRTTAEMMTKSTFSNWDIVDYKDHDGDRATAIWFIKEGAWITPNRKVKISGSFIPANKKIKDGTFDVIDKKIKVSDYPRLWWEY